MLDSSNKERAVTLAAVFPDARHDLLKSNSKSLQYIHNAFGYDFTKPFSVTGFTGHFTANKIEKATGINSGILLLWTKNIFYVAELCPDGKFNISGFYSSYSNGFDRFVSRGDFEAARKSGTAAFYFISQPEEYRLPLKPGSLYSSPYYRECSSEYDKSGNNLTKARRDLHSRLKKYKAGKRAMEAAAHDWSGETEHIDTLLSGFKKLLVSRISSALTSKDYSSLNRISFFSLSCLVRDIEYLKNDALNKKFSSMEKARSEIDGAKAKLQGLINVLGG